MNEQYCRDCFLVRIHDVYLLSLSNKEGIIPCVPSIFLSPPFFQSLFLFPGLPISVALYFEGSIIDDSSISLWSIYE